MARFTLILVKIGTAEVLSEEVSWCQFQVVQGYLDFLALVLNNRWVWFSELILASIHI